MKLTYRGVSYDYTPNATPLKGSVYDTGTYRGHPVAFQALTELPAQPEADLTWRGVAYHRGHGAVSSEPVSTPVANAPATVLPNGPVVSLARNLFIRHHQRSRKREQGMLVRLAAEVGIPVAASASYESHIQGKLPHDFAGYDRSSAALS
ncbi:MAG: DUF4278 domain-containing protein [Leptolyngbya sp. LCM1.Bin17]|nr:MAG: DUF4278 domain-containing protein [Leptolyngbya sp. LCM1.Bin17]